MKNPGGRVGKLWFWLGIILLSISASIWLLVILGIVSDPEIDWGDLTLGGVVITFVPIGLGIYCVRRGRKSPVMAATSVSDGYIPGERCRDCRRTDDLAQCPECHLWFCKEHDTHECIPQPQTSDLQERIALARTRRDIGEYIIALTLVIDATILAILDYCVSRNLISFIAFCIPVLVTVTLFALGSVIKRYYGGQLRKFGVYSRRIRPQTAKKDH